MTWILVSLAVFPGLFLVGLAMALAVIAAWGGRAGHADESEYAAGGADVVVPFTEPPRGAERGGVGE